MSWLVTPVTDVADFDLFATGKPEFVTRKRRISALAVDIFRLGAGRRLLGCEAVAGPGLGEDERRAPLRLELGSQAAHVDPEVLGLGLVAVPPDPSEQVGVGEQLAPVDRELAQQGELGRGQV